MSRKTLAWHYDDYLEALAYATVLGCDLSLEQYAAALHFEPAELDELREEVERKGAR